MTPQFLVEAPVKDQVEWTAQAWHIEPPWATATGGVRVTRDAGAGQTLVAVVGLGYAGLPSAMALRRAGFRIVGIDTSSSRLEEIRSGRAALLAAHGEDLRGHLRDEGFVLTDKIEAVHAADLVLICVPTMLDSRGRPNPEALGARAHRSWSTREQARRSC